MRSHAAQWSTSDLVQKLARCTYSQSLLMEQRRQHIGGGIICPCQPTGDIMCCRLNSTRLHQLQLVVFNLYSHVKCIGAPRLRITVNSDNMMDRSYICGGKSRSRLKRYFTSGRHTCHVIQNEQTHVGVITQRGIVCTKSSSSQNSMKTLIRIAVLRIAQLSPPSLLH